MADDKNTNLRGVNLCPTCGEPVIKIEGTRTRRCLACLRQVKTVPPYPCTGCHQLRERGKCKELYCESGKGCSAWGEWALITWHHINLRAAQLLEEKKEAENDG